MKEVQNVLRNYGITPVDLTVVDLFLWFIDLNIIPKEKVMKEVEHYDHDEIVDILVSVGASLGFDAYKEVSIAKGARVDVVWSAKIGNLGIMGYVFEVHLRGSIDSLILNLQKAKKNPQVQKVVVVSTPAQIEKIREEIKAVSVRLCKACFLFRDK